MSPQDQLTAARSLVDQVAAIVRRERYDGLVWSQRLERIAAVLDDAEVPVAERLAAAQVMVREMYAGPRNFADFHLFRGEPATVAEDNRRLSVLTAELTEVLT